MRGAGIKIRQYHVEDSDAIVRLDEACFSEQFRFDRESMRKFAEAREAITLVAEDVSGGIAGFAIAHIEENPPGKRAYVVTLDVAEANRRMGVAGRLMAEMERRAAHAGAVSMELHVFVENEGAIRFYEGQGYRRVGRRAGFYGRGLNAWVYRKGLKQAR